MLLNIALLSIGAIIGAFIRWQLSIWFSLTPLPSGSGILAANWLGAYLIGIFALLPAPWLNETLKLFLITGMLGSLTTFSSFSLETASLIQSGRWAAAAYTILLHLGGSLLFTFAGFATIAWYKALSSH